MNKSNDINNKNIKTIVVHENPVWRSEADFIIRAEINPGEIDQKIRWEQLWVMKLATNRYKMCCIPFFLYNLSLGDEVEIEEIDNQYVFKRVVKKSGRYTFRIWFMSNDKKDEIAKTLKDMGCLLEWRFKSGNLLAVDMAKKDHAQEVADYLIQLEEQKILEYETGAV